MSEHNDDTRNQPNQEETTKFCGKSNTVENMFQKAMPQVPNIGISKTASTGNLQSPVSNRYTKLKAETKVTLSEADGLILRPDTNYLHLNAYSSSVPTSPSLMSPSLSRKSMADGQRYHLRHPSGNTRSSGGSSNASNTRSHSTVVETRHISLEYDPVRKRKLLNTYEILSDLGFGQHGKVKLALDTVTGDKVAIKILDRTGRAKVGAKYYYTGNQDTVTSPPEYMSENEVKIRKEIAIMKKCDHENIVKLREVIDDHRLRKIYLVLEYLEKGEIKWQSEESHEFTTESGEKSIEITTKPVLSFKQARTVFRDVVLGLEYLHYQGIIHRDIKPANLLISKDNIVKISDFGVSFSISFMENSEYDLCKTAGTPAFYAPELCSADTNSVDECGRHIISHKVDIWALGVTLYCLMFGKLPFYGKNDFELFDKISKTEPEIPTFEMFEEYGSDVSESLYKDLVDVLGKLLKKDPHERIDIPELKEHSFLINSLESSNDFHRFYNNIAIYRSDSSSDEEEQTSLRKIDVSKEEMGNAITDIGNKLKSSLSKVLNFTGFSSSTSSLKSRTSMPSISPNVPAQRHRLSVSSMFSKKPTHSHSNSTASSRKNSRSNTVYTPPQVQALRHEDSSLSLKSGAYSINSDQSLPESDFRKALHKTASLYSHNNSTGSSFISPSLQNTQAMSQDYFPVERAMYSNVDVASCSDVLKTHHHKRSVSNTSAQLSDACIEAGFFVHTKPVANTLNGIMERSDKAMRPRVERFESPLNSPSLKGAQSPSIFGLGSKSRNNSFLSSSGYNNGITLPRKSSNVSLPVNSSYASLNSIDDEFLYSSNNDDAKRRVGYITPGYDTEGAVKNNYSGLLNNANSNSGFLNAFNNDASKFRFHEDSIKEKIYGRKNKDLLKFDSYSLSTGPTSSESQAVSRAVSPATDDNRYAASKAPSVSTINEAQSNKTLSHLHRNSSNSSSSSSSNVSDSSEDLYSTGDDVLQFSAANYQDRTSRAFFMGSGRNSVENTDTESYNQNELRMVDSVVTVPNSIISKLNSADNSTQPSQTQLLSYYTASRATKPGNTAHKSNNIPPNNSVFPKNFMNGEKQLKFQFGAAEDDDRESDDTDASSDRSLFFPNPDLLNRKLVTQRNLSDDSKSSIKSSGDESDQELTFNFNGRKLVSDRSKSISQASDRNKSISQASQASKASDISHGN